MSYPADKTGKIDYSRRGLSVSLEENLSIFSDIFSDDLTFQSRSFGCQADPNIICAVLYIDGMTSSEIINEHIIKPVTLASLTGSPQLFDVISSSVVVGNEMSVAQEVEPLVQAMLYGDTVVLVDGAAKGMVVNSKGFALRGISEPDDEKSLRGPREGFTESMMMNTSMIRRRLQTSDLKFKKKSFGTRTGTKACLCYLDSLVNREILAELERRLDAIGVDGVLDTNYIHEFVKDSPYSVFKTCGSTEKPDIVAAKLLEGRIALILDGTPIVMTAPYLFIENLQATDDYYTSFYYGSLGRLLRIIGLLTTVSAPAVYVALVCYHPEMIPTSLMLSIAAAVSKVPFPTVVECVGMLLVFEVLRETGIRIPNKIGQALSVVGALIVGQAAVEARIVSAPVVIVVALTGITGFMNPRMSGAALTVKFALIAAAAAFGFYGYFLAMVALFLYLTGIKSFGVDYMSQLFTYNPGLLKDIYIRAPMPRMNTRPLSISRDPERQG